jgi:hypothetical protein
MPRGCLSSCEIEVHGIFDRATRSVTLARGSIRPTGIVGTARDVEVHADCEGIAGVARGMSGGATVYVDRASLECATAYPVP